ncbi:Pentatricopeptide repeat-containing protein, chloroplastic, partial [Sesbania bispinosa]
MEVNLCLNHHHHRALRLTPSLSLSTPRTQFLGCAHSLRPPPPLPPGLRSRNKRNNKLGLLRLHSPRFVFKASFHSHPVIVVVIVVTLSAVSLLHFTLNKKKKTLDQTRGHAKFALSPQGSNVGNQVIDSQIIGFPEFQRDNPLNEINGEDNHVFEEKEVHLPVLQSSMVHETAFTTETSESSSSNLDSSVIDSQILGFQEFQRDDQVNDIGNLKDPNGEDNHVSEDIEVHLPFLQSSMVHEAAFTTETSDSWSNLDSSVIDSQILGFQEFQRGDQVNDIGKLKDHNGEDNHVSEDKEVRFPFLQSSMVHEAAFATETSESSSSNLDSSVIDSQILSFPEFQRDNQVNDIGKLKDRNGEDNHALEDKEVRLPFLESPMVHEAAFTTETSESSSSSLDSSVNNNSSKVLDESFLSVAFQSSSLQPLAFAEDMALQVEENQDQVDSDPKLPLNTDKSKHTASSVCVNNALATINEHTKEKIELGAISSEVLFGESVREGLYMFYEDNKSATGSMTPLSSLKSLSPHASFMSGKGLPSAVGNTMIKGSGLSTEFSLKSAEYVEGAVKISSHKEGYPPQHVGKNLRKGSRSPRNRERNSMDHNSSKVLPHNAHSIRVNGDQENDQIRVHDGQKIDPSEHLSKYNNLLKAGRLHECVNLLKDVETKGLLDMTK